MNALDTMQGRLKELVKWIVTTARISGVVEDGLQEL